MTPFEKQLINDKKLLIEVAEGKVNNIDNEIIRLKIERENQLKIISDAHAEIRAVTIGF